MKFLKVVLALVIGALAGFLIYMDLALILFREPPAWFVLLAFFGGWGLTTWWVLKGSETISQMLGKSFLIGAIVSFGLTPAILALAAKSVDTTGSDAQVAGSVIGGGLASGFGIAISLTLTFLSIVGYGLVKLFNREDRLGSSGMTACEYCSEPIRSTAKKCRHCGEFLDSKKSVTPITAKAEGIEREGQTCSAE